MIFEGEVRLERCYDCGGSIDLYDDKGKYVENLADLIERKLKANEDGSVGRLIIFISQQEPPPPPKPKPSPFLSLALRVPEPTCNCASSVADFHLPYCAKWGNKKPVEGN